ncbi:MAG TPA: tetratricopeptide repeat protein [Blastocatellia bacterium]|nr:tetratricopeptide repeat protein [Blastocatellia bacterium]
MSIRDVLNRLTGRQASGSDERSGLSRLDRCPQETDFLDYFEERLSQARRAQFEGHFVECDDCREFLALYAQLSEDHPQILTPSLEPLSEETVRKQTERVLSLIEQDEFNPQQNRSSQKKWGWGFQFPYFRFATVAVVVLAAVASIYVFLTEPSEDDLAMQSLALAIRNERHIEPRVSGNLAWSPYASLRGEISNDRLAMNQALDKLRFAEESSAPTSSRLALARVLLASGERGRAARALEILREVAASGERSAAVLNDMGVASFQLGDYREAVSLFTEALEKNPSYEEALFNRALANHLAQRREEAKRDWTEFIRKASDEKWRNEAQQNLDNLNRSSAVL